MALENYTIHQIDYRTAMDLIVIVREHYLHGKRLAAWRLVCLWAKS